MPGPVAADTRRAWVPPGSSDAKGGIVHGMDGKDAALELLLLMEAGDEPAFVERARSLAGDGRDPGADGRELLKLAVDRGSEAMVEAMLGLHVSPRFMVVVENGTSILGMTLVSYALARGDGGIVVPRGWSRIRSFSSRGGPRWLNRSPARARR